MERHRRSLLKSIGAIAGLQLSSPWSSLAQANFEQAPGITTRPLPQDRRFRSVAVEEFLTATSRRIGDPVLQRLFVNCFPNTLDTTVEPGSFDGRSDTVVITGDIAAMWLRDSSAQVWPYLPLAKRDPALRDLLAGVIRRQTRCLLIDPYANAFMANLNAPPLPWSLQDKTEMKPGVGERKYELDSLCYPIRLAHGYWQQTGDASPFDAAWHKAMTLIVQTMRVQQRKHGDGPYRFLRTDDRSTETLPNGGRGNPVRPNGMIASGFRPSDDACIFPFFVPANLFAVSSLEQLAEMANSVLKDASLANDAILLSVEVRNALQQDAIVMMPGGTVWAYEIDGFGSRLIMDDANVPSLLSLPYLGCSPDPALYARTRALVWSDRNPWFFRGTAGEGVGGPHKGQDMIWPMSQIIYALTALEGNQPGAEAEIRRALVMLKGAAANYGFIHESYDRNDVARFTRSWFAWANTLFGECIAELAQRRPELLR
jgi:meiotically up-regulated gene 157 (Mug157) protein